MSRFGFLRIFKREPWETHGIGHSVHEVNHAIVKQFYAAHKPDISFFDGSKLLRCLDENKRMDLLVEVERRYGMLPPYDLERYNCNHETGTRLGQVAETWGDLSRGHEALCMGWIHLWYKDATSPHLAWWFMRDNLTFDIIQPRSFETVTRPIKNIWRIQQI